MENKRIVRPWQAAWMLLVGIAVIIAGLLVMKLNNRYRYRVTLYCNQSKAVRRAAANIVMYCNTEKSFRDVTVFADDNPLD